MPPPHLPGARRVAAGLAAALTLGLAGSARAADPAGEPREQLRAGMVEYFGREKSAALTFLGFGIASLGVGAGLTSRPDPFVRSTGITVGALGLVQVAGAIFYYVSIDGRVARLNARIDADAAAFRRDESARMAGVTSRFLVLRFIEAGVIVAGVGLAAAGELKDSGALKGVGLGLAIESATLLGLDFLADASAHEYATHLRRFPATPLVTPVTGPRGQVSGGVFGIQGMF
jgi:hypothetical protein